MLIAEYDYDTDIAVQREEAGKIAFAKGISQGIYQGISQGISQGSHQKALETARLMKQANCEIPFIAKMTGLTQAEVESIHNS